MQRQAPRCGRQRHRGHGARRSQRREASLDLLSCPVRTSHRKRSSTCAAIPCQRFESLMRRRAAAERSRHQPSGRAPILIAVHEYAFVHPTVHGSPSVLGDRCIRCLYEPAIRRSRKRVMGVDDHRGCGAAIMNTVSLLSMRPGAGHSWIDENSPFREGMRSRASAPLLFGAHLSSLRIVRRTLVGAPE